MTNNEKEKSYWGILVTALTIIALILTLLTAINEGLDAWQQPTIPLILGGIILIAAIISASYILANRSEYPRSQLIVGTTVLILGTVTILLSVGFWVGSHWQSPMPTTTPADSTIPLRIIESFDFDYDDPNLIGTTPWMMVPQENTSDITISHDANTAHSDVGSLRLFVELDAFDQNTLKEWAGIHNPDNYANARAITAWILVPLTEQSSPVRGIKFWSHLQTANQGPDNESIFIYSDVVELTPGKWTPLFLGIPSAATNIGRSGPVDHFEIRMWCNKPYSGSVFLDDITIYSAE